MAWQRPSPRVAELIRQGALILLADPEAMASASAEAALAGQSPGVLEDPVLVQAIRRTNRANLVFWAESNVRDPGGEVGANLGPETLGIARDFVRRGLEETALEPYRLGQNAAWTGWMEIAFALTEDAGELRELLEVSARSIFAFVDATVSGIVDRIQRERDELTRGTEAERREVVGLIVSGAPVAARRASLRLGYELAQRHIGAILWHEEARDADAALDRAATVVAELAGGRRPLVVVASAAARWVWVPAHGRLDIAALADAVRPLEGVRVALGDPAEGPDGFRRTHLDAAETQRLLDRLQSPRRVAAYASARLIALLTQDASRAEMFVRSTLGALETADRELRETVRTHLREGSSATRTARATFTHRNTVLGRLHRADELLPRPLAEYPIEVAVALEAVHWRRDAD